MHAELIQEAVEGKTPVELAKILESDGFVGGVEGADRIIRLCQEGKFGEAGQAAHLDGWL